MKIPLLLKTFLIAASIAAIFAALVIYIPFEIGMAVCGGGLFVVLWVCVHKVMGG